MINQKNILKIKTGYNPNSSSIGTEITTFLKGTVVFTVFVNLLLMLIDNVKEKSKFRRKK